MFHKSFTIALAKPSLGQAEIDAAVDVLRSGWVIRGPQTQQFEAEFASFVSTKHAVATNGCTMALYLAIKQLGLDRTDEVIVPSLTWSATTAAVIHAGATPVFADVRSTDWCLDPDDVRHKMTPHTRLVVPVHFAGRFARGFEDWTLPIIYDSAHRIVRNDVVGHASCYSFYAVKNMTTIRGGMVVTNDPTAAAWYRMGCHGGIAKDTLSRYRGSDAVRDASSFYYEVDFPGWNFDMTDVEAAIGREQLKKVEQFNQQRDALVARYNDAFGLRNSGNHLYPILVSNRDEFLVRMKEASIQCGVHYLPLHQMKAYRPYSTAPLPVTEYIGQRCASLPLYPSLTDAEVSHIIDSVRQYADFVPGSSVHRSDSALSA